MATDQSIVYTGNGGEVCKEVDDKTQVNDHMRVRVRVRVFITAYRRAVARWEERGRSIPFKSCANHVITQLVAKYGSVNGFTKTLWSFLSTLLMISSRTRG